MMVDRLAGDVFRFGVDVQVQVGSLAPDSKYDHLKEPDTGTIGTAETLL